MTTSMQTTLTDQDFASSPYGIMLVDRGIEDSGSAIQDFATMQEAEEAARHANSNRGHLYGEGGEFRGVRGEWFAYKV